jgi:hypothetical protein
MELFAEPNWNTLELKGSYDASKQVWVDATGLPTMRTNYQTWNRTQRQTTNQTANNDYIPDFPDDNDPDFQSD